MAKGKKSTKGIYEGLTVIARNCIGGCSKKGVNWGMFKTFSSTYNKETGNFSKQVNYSIFDNDGVKYNDGDLVKIEKITGVKTTFTNGKTGVICQTTINAKTTLVKSADEIEEENQTLDAFTSFEESIADIDTIVVDDESYLDFS